MFFAKSVVLPFSYTASFLFHWCFLDRFDEALAVQDEAWGKVVQIGEEF